MSEGDFVALWQRYGSARLMAKATNIPIDQIYRRRRRLQGKGLKLDTTEPAEGYETRTPEFGWTFPREHRLEIENGIVIVSSDHHYWPGEPSVAHRALLHVIKKLKPRAKILNGDIFDGVSLSRHDPFGWSERPTVTQELEACQERVHEIELAIPKGCKRLWNIGNHCLRFERTLAKNAKEYSGILGTRLSDHFPGWEMQWSTFINPDVSIPTMVKHKNAGGVHAGYNNTLKGGVHTVTGHTHILEVKPWGDYRGRRYGVQTGTLSDITSPAFEYMENGPSSACSGFAVLTFRDGNLTPPELCEVIDGRAWFRGEVIAE